MSKSYECVATATALAPSQQTERQPAQLTLGVLQLLLSSCLQLFGACLPVDAPAGCLRCQDRLQCTSFQTQAACCCQLYVSCLIRTVQSSWAWQFDRPCITNRGQKPLLTVNIQGRTPVSASAPSAPAARP